MNNSESLIKKLSDNAELGFAVINRMQELLTKEIAHKKDLPLHYVRMIQEDLVRLRWIEGSIRSLELLENVHLRKKEVINE